MFYALARDLIDTGDYRFEHELVDIETLNRRALTAELELTAVSLHAYAYLSDKYVLCSAGASMGDKYGPMVVTREQRKISDLRDLTIAVPGTWTTAYLALRLCLDTDFRFVEVPFDKIIEATVEGSYEGQQIDAGLIIHEGQLTYGQDNLNLVVDLGKWWYEETELPLPLGANAVRRDLGDEAIAEIHRLLKASIKFGLDHRSDALDYAEEYGRGLDRSMADEFVGMYVNDWTLDFGPVGRKAVTELLKRGYEAGVIPQLITPEFVG